MDRIEEPKEMVARYRFNGKCPDCGAVVKEEGEPWKSNHSKVRTFYVDCTKCSYSATGREERNITRPAFVMWPRHDVPPKVIVRETRPRIESIIEEMDYIKQQAEWLIKETSGG